MKTAGYIVLLIGLLGANVSMWTAVARKGSIGAGDVLISVLLLIVVGRGLYAVLRYFQNLTDGPP